MPSMQKIGRNVIGKGTQDVDAMSVTMSSISQVMPPLKKGKFGSCKFILLVFWSHTGCFVTMMIDTNVCTSLYLSNADDSA